MREAGARFIVLTLHWGWNLRASPGRRFRRFARAAIDAGVDLVHGHSAHLVHAVERYGGGVILYDTGNFLDDYWVCPFFRTDRSFVFFVDMVGDRPVRLRMLPVVISDRRVQLAREREFEVIRRKMQTRCRGFQTPVFLTSEGLEIPLMSSEAGWRRGGRRVPAAPRARSEGLAAGALARTSFAFSGERRSMLADPARLAHGIDRKRRELFEVFP
ncbi:MAG: CapA family protein [Alphaproteobacteria bacterium]